MTARNQVEIERGAAEVKAAFAKNQEHHERNAKIAEALCDSIGRQVAALFRLGAFPAHWDGHEVRALLASEFENEVPDQMRRATPRRRSFRVHAAEGMSRRHEVRP